MPRITPFGGLRAIGSGRSAGVAYHRLSADEHSWISDELITPTVPANVVPQDDPRAVYVIGQPGAGNTEATRTVRRVPRSAPPASMGVRL